VSTHDPLDPAQNPPPASPQVTQQIPHQDPDRTMLVPTPGGRRPAAPPVANNAAQTPQLPPSGAPLAGLPGKGLNRLVHAANPLLDLVVPLRMMAQPPDLQALRERLASAVRTFETEARGAGVDAEAIAAARYALCTLLDETISSTAWGSGVWGSRSLLVAFHNEASGGEKVFLILQRLSQNVAANLDALELMYLCLALGLEGRYHMVERGQAQLATLRERLLQMIRQQRGAYETDLSLEWRGAATAAAAPLRRVPLWVWLAGVGVLLLGVQLVASNLLNRASDPVYAGMAAIRVAPPAPSVQAAPAPALVSPPAPARLAGFLAPEVAQGLVSVRETAERSVITLRGDGMFDSGSAEVNPTINALLARIGDALKTTPGKVIVVGHTDNTKPGLSARFPSNYDLSKARAAGVMAALVKQAGPAQRFNAEGRGETEALVANDTPVHRARNRRVDIIVLTPALAP
jgi:type VI secretion system protein ImpK